MKSSQPTQGMFMNKTELIEATAAEADISKAAAGRALDAILGAVVKAVANGDSVTLMPLPEERWMPSSAPSSKR
ncbi:MAG: hypothetical protein B7X87_14265 [Hydrogenophilales bacterium 17-64-34]|nr:MAG: hypothetical protein B7X87_14265 [Hydrogenophilales bacterium 17-64-34]